MAKLTKLERFGTLTEREREVLEIRLKKGLSYANIAKKLHVSKNTIKTHMANIYIKFGLDSFDKEERVRLLTQEYAPFVFRKDIVISKKKEENEFPSYDQPEVIDVEVEPEPISSEVEKMIDEDEYALMTIENNFNLAAEEKEEDMKPPRRFLGIRIVITLIILALAAYGGWQLWQDIQSQSFSDLISTNPVNIVEKRSAVEVDEWVEQDGIWLRIKEYEIDDYEIAIDFEIWNKTDQSVLFNWSKENNFKAVTNTNINLDRTNGGSLVMEEILEGGEKRVLNYNYTNATTSYDADDLFTPSVTDVYIEVEYLSRIDKAVFHIPINK